MLVWIFMKKNKLLHISTPSIEILTCQMKKICDLLILDQYRCILQIGLKSYAKLQHTF